MSSDPIDPLSPPPPLPFRGLREFNPEDPEHVAALAAHHRHEAARYAAEVSACAEISSESDLPAPADEMLRDDDEALASSR